MICKQHPMLVRTCRAQPSPSSVVLHAQPPSKAAKVLRPWQSPLFSLPCASFSHGVLGAWPGAYRLGSPRSLFGSLFLFSETIRSWTPPLWN